MDIMDIIMSKAIAKKYADSQLSMLAYSNVILEGVFEPDRHDVIETNITDIKPGDTVRVIWNGVAYMCVAYEYRPDENTRVVVFGNTAYINGNSDGVPFIHMIYPDENGNLLSGFAEVAVLMTFCGLSFDGSVSIKVFTETTEDLLDSEGKIASNFMPNWSVSNSVDLDFYGIGQVTLSLFAQGGGNAIVENVRSFWNRLSKKENLLLSLKYSGFTIIIDGHTRFVTVDDEGNFSCANLCYSFMATDETLTSYKIDVSIVRNGDNAVVVVKVA